MNIVYRNDYLLSTLPTLEPIGSIPPISKSELLGQVVDSNGPVRTVEMILLSDDLIQYEAFLSEETGQDKIDLAVLSLEKAENESVLPEFLLPEEETQEEDKHLSVDGLWSRYFRYAESIAKRNHSSFLKVWIAFEVGLRNALTVARSHILDLDPEAYLVTPELADTDIDYTNIISSWSAAPTPLAALEVLDKARWEWLEENGNWYSCSDDEIEVYAAKLILLHHWRRILSDNQQNNKKERV
jgi:hypothetical protein